MQQQQFINKSKIARHVLATILPIIRSIRLYNAACGMNHSMSCRPVRPPTDNSLS